MLFRSCYNYWIICHLVRGDDGKAFIAYSPMLSLEDSTKPFQALLGAILSVKHQVPVQTSTFNPDMELDDISDDGDTGNVPLSDVIDNSLGESSRTNMVPETCSHLPISQVTEPWLKVCAVQHLAIFLSIDLLVYLQITSSSPHFPESYQIWVQVQPLQNTLNSLVLPHYADIAKKGNKQLLRLTHIIGSGSTGNVWECHFDNSDDLFAIKVVEPFHRDRFDTEYQQRFYDELEVYLTLEMAYQSGKLQHHITPYCYGAFTGNKIDVLILELCDGVLHNWDGLNVLER